MLGKKEPPVQKGVGWKKLTAVHVIPDAKNMFGQELNTFPFS